MTRCVLTVALVLLVPTAAFPQPDQLRTEPPRKPAAPVVEKLGKDLLRVGTIRVDTAKREISVGGTANDVTVLEFVANTRNGMKAYESALTLDTDAITFNTALVLIGLDRANAVPAERPFDPKTPKGDPVEVWVEWKDGDRTRRERAEKLMYDTEKQVTLPEGPWVYVGSVFVEDGYLAEIEGVLIGFVHSPSAVIDNPTPFGVVQYGRIQFNPTLGLKGGTPVTVTVRAIGSAAR